MKKRFLTTAAVLGISAAIVSLAAYASSANPQKAPDLKGGMADSVVLLVTPGE